MSLKILNSLRTSKKVNSPYFLLASVIIIWGLNYVVGRLLAHSFPSIPGLEQQHMNGTLYGFFRYLFGTLTMVLILIYQRKDIKTIFVEIKPIKGVLFLSALFSAIFVLSASASNEFISSGTTSVIINLCPILVFIYGILFLHEGLNKIKVLGFIAGLFGGILFLINSFNAYSGSTSIGVILAVLAMISWGGYSVLLHYMSGNDSYIIMAVKHGISTLITIPILYFLIIEKISGSIFIFDLWTIFGIIFGGVIATGLAYVIYFKAIETIGAPKASAFLFLIPFVSLLGDLLLGELPQLLSLIGGIIALLGVFLIKISKK